VSYSGLKEVQDAIYSRLSGDSTLGALVEGVVGDAAAGQAYPYVLITNALGDPWNTLGGTSTGRGYEYRISVHVYSQYEGDKEAQEIRDRVIELLNHYDLSVSGFSTVICEYLSDRLFLKDIEKIQTRHLPIIFRVRIHQ
jgi:hypothetical protein